MPSVIAAMLAGLGLGVGLAGSPGPVQAILLAESIRGGTSRGFRAQAGANITFGVLLVALALGLAVVAPSGVVLRLLEIAGGALLVWLAIDGLRSRHQTAADPTERRRLPPAARGLLAVVLNPGTYLFLATAASSVLTPASRLGGIGAVLGGAGVRRAGARVVRLVRSALAGLLAVLGVVLAISGVVG